MDRHLSPRYGHVITKFSGMGRFTMLWGSAHARASRPLEAPLKMHASIHWTTSVNAEKACLKEVYIPPLW